MFQVAPANRAIIPKYHFNRESRHNRSVVTLWNLPRPLKGLRVSEPWFRMSAPEIGNVPRLRPTLGRKPPIHFTGRRLTVLARRERSRTFVAVSRATVADARPIACLDAGC
jgi:hypothetical protein